MSHTLGQKAQNWCYSALASLQIPPQQARLLHTVSVFGRTYDLMWAESVAEANLLIEQEQNTKTEPKVAAKLLQLTDNPVCIGGFALE